VTEYEYETNSSQETYDLGVRLGEAAKPGEVYVLNGDLGVGKTVFAQGFAWGLGIREAVNSPTFTILQIYEEGRIPLYHFDVYRLTSPEEMEEIGYDDYFYGKGVCLIEWGSQIRELLPNTSNYITIVKNNSISFDYRRILLEKHENVT
jgi:tRNA threonylcarbamoyladenosine biosynthesis protein TsaE